MNGRYRWTALFGLAAALLVMATTPADVSAECTGLDRWPSFTDAARSAEVIVIGEVAESFHEADVNNDPDHTIRFRFRVDEVLRGRSDVVLDFPDGVRSGLPLTICPGDSVLRVRVRDHLAMAFGARYPRIGGPVTAIAFLDRTPDAFFMPGMERLTLGQVHSIANLPPTDTGPIVKPNERTSPVGLLLIGLIGGWFADRHLRKRAE